MRVRHRGSHWVLKPTDYSCKTLDVLGRHLVPTVPHALMRLLLSQSLTGSSWDDWKTVAL